jgi:hypothetical protein
MTTNQKQFTRVCPNPKKNPKCKGILTYGCAWLRNRATEAGSLCKSCGRIGKEFSEEHRNNLSKALKGLMTGEKNPFFGRTHSEESRRKIGAKSIGRYFSPEAREKISKIHKGKRQSAEHIAKRCTEVFCQKIAKAMQGDKNPFYGQKHSEESRKKIKAAWSRRGPCSLETRQKMSAASKGSKNHQYGKPSPIGTSRGIGGWYKGLYFRSSCELAFLLQHKDVKWKSAEGARLGISYQDSEGEDHVYFADFIADGLLVEIKPWGCWELRAKNQEVARIKMRAAFAFCQKHGLEYLVAEMTCFKPKEIFALRKKNSIKLNDKWEKKYQIWKAAQVA